MAAQAVASVTLTDLSRGFSAPWRVEISSLAVHDRLGLLGDTASLSFDREPNESGAWNVSGLEDFPRSVRVDVSLGIEGGDPPVDHGPYYLRRGSGTAMESGTAYQFSLTRASASADMERILRASWVRQYAYLLGRDFPTLSPYTVQSINERQGYDGLVNGLLEMGLGAALAPLTDDNIGQLTSVRPGYADGWVDAQTAAFMDGWRGVPVPFLFRLGDLFTLRPADRRRSAFGVDLFQSAVALDLDGYDLKVSMPDLRRRNNLTENRANIRYTLKGGDSLQRSALRQAGHTGLDVIPGPPLSPTVSGEDLLPPTPLGREFPDEASADLAVYGKAAQQSVAAISATAEIDWNPYLRNGQVVRHARNLYRLVEIAHNLDQASSALTMVPLVDVTGQL